MSSVTFSLLRLLADGHFHSGTDLALKLTCSRSTIWHHIKKLQSLGLQINALPNRGYRLTQPFDLLDMAQVQDYLSKNECPFTLTYCEETVSTNTDVLSISKHSAENHHVLVCEHQTGGKGRHGKSWISPLGQGLTFSVLWRFQQRIDMLSSLTLVIGLSVLGSIQSFKTESLRLKWPNDLVTCDTNAKICGILVNIQGDLLGPCAAIIGIGLNVHQPPVDVNRDYEAVALNELDNTYLSRNTVLSKILVDLYQTLRLFEQANFLPFQEAWNQNSVWDGEDIEATLPDGTLITGKSIGVDETGALMIEQPSHDIYRLISGNVTLRKKHGRHFNN